MFLPISLRAFTAAISRRFSRHRHNNSSSSNNNNKTVLPLIRLMVLLVRGNRSKRAKVLRERPRRVRGSPKRANRRKERQKKEKEKEKDKEKE